MRKLRVLNNRVSCHCLFVLVNDVHILLHLNLEINRGLLYYRDTCTFCL